MPIPATRTIQVDTIRNFGAEQDEVELSDLTRIQTDSFARFLQVGRDAKSRKDAPAASSSLGANSRTRTYPRRVRARCSRA